MKLKDLDKFTVQALGQVNRRYNILVNGFKLLYSNGDLVK